MSSDFGKRLKAARERAGLTQPQLAQKAGLAQSTVSAAEASGDGSRSTVQLAKACDVDPLWLATGDGLMGTFDRRHEVREPYGPGGPFGAPGVAAALAVLGQALAVEMTADVRQDIADTLAKLALRHGLERHQSELVRLLHSAPGKGRTAA